MKSCSPQHDPDLWEALQVRNTHTHTHAVQGLPVPVTLMCKRTSPQCIVNSVCIYSLLLCVFVCVGGQLHHLSQLGLPSRLSVVPPSGRLGTPQAGGYNWSTYDDEFSKPGNLRDAVSPVS